MNYYVHDLSPFLIQFNENIGIRWYGLAYIAGFIVAFLLLRQLSRRELFPIPEDKIENFIMLGALWGVLIGGRLGYCLFYGFDAWVHDPLFPFKLWQGGMASHGGILGIMIHVIWYAKKNKHSFLQLTDNLVCVGPVGLFFGRIANFVNGELWGRATEVRWAVIFPQSGDGLPRHPSQLYEALGEGLIPFLILWTLRFRPISQRSGFLSGLFLLIYAVARISIECFREPDSNIYFDWLTKGQLYSVAMIIGGIFLLARSRTVEKKSA